MAETDKNVTPPSAGPQPGQVVTPGGTAAPTATATPSQPGTTVSKTSPAPTQNATAAPPPAPLATQTSDGTISWTASEFIAHEKSAGWYIALTGIALAVAALVFLIVRDIISTVVVLVAAFAFGVLGSRKPRQQQYSLGASGLTVGQKHFGYSEFRSFSVVPEGAFSSIVFMPLKRFAPLTTIYYAPEDEDKIVDLISANLPFEERKADPLDNLMSRIRF